MSTNYAPKVRSLYRRILRELPCRLDERGQSILSNPSPLQRNIRASLFATAAPAQNDTESRIQEGEQFVQYIVAQRRYLSMLETYFPGKLLAPDIQTLI